ncbi:HTH domain-containing protein [Actinospica sp. MGRD01-02]|uniref:HTH domain-containing protein n=1 Tax=Actinospica acidithermotolerans TaxID=2828514 RepID=A0A941EH16_9ACTN|nr:HTH domain-containing protein [Actinospica acidithermotolerans]MBR7830253.1 HTH domain-containing protein [Actinospica acidithermotolerans]
MQTATRFDGARLAAVRRDALGVTQAEFAQRVREAGRTLGFPHLRCAKRLVQKWENGEHAVPSVPYQKAIAYVTRMDFESFCRAASRADVEAERVAPPLAEHGAENESGSAIGSVIVAAPFPQRGRAHQLRLDGRHLRAVRVEKLGLSQADFAVAVQAAADRLGFNVHCTKRLVQKWESGDHAMPIPEYRKALEFATGESIATLCEPILPASPSEVANRLAILIEEQAEHYQKLTELYAYLTRPPSPQRGPLRNEDLIEQIRAQRATGAGSRTIATRLGVSETTVKRYIEDMTAPIVEYKPMTEELANEARMLYRNDRNLTIAELAGRYAVHPRQLADAISGKTYRNSGATPVYTLRPEPDFSD